MAEQRNILTLPYKVKFEEAKLQRIHELLQNIESEIKVCRKILRGEKIE